METPLGPMIKPMIESAQTSLKIASNPLFDKDGNFNTKEASASVAIDRTKTLDFGQNILRGLAAMQAAQAKQ